jgi:hypothetical protein
MANQRIGVVVLVLLCIEVIFTVWLLAFIDRILGAPLVFAGTSLITGVMKKLNWSLEKGRYIVSAVLALTAANAPH